MKICALFVCAIFLAGFAGTISGRYQSLMYNYHMKEGISHLSYFDENSYRREYKPEEGFKHAVKAWRHFQIASEYGPVENDLLDATEKIQGTIVNPKITDALRKSTFDEYDGLWEDFNTFVNKREKIKL